MLVDAHHGELTLTSTVGVGTVARIRLPLTEQSTSLRPRRLHLPLDPGAAAVRPRGVLRMKV
jgi:hypothetical protein